MLRKPFLRQDRAGIEVHLRQRGMMPVLPQGLQEGHGERTFGQRAEGVDPIGGRLGIAAAADHRDGTLDPVSILWIYENGSFQHGLLSLLSLESKGQVERRPAVATVKEDERPAPGMLRQQRKEFGVQQVAGGQEITGRNGFAHLVVSVSGLDTVTAEMDPQLVARSRGRVKKAAQGRDDIGFGWPQRRIDRIVAQQHDVVRRVIVGIHEHVDHVDDIVNASAQGISVVVNVVCVVATDQ